MASSLKAQSFLSDMIMTNKLKITLSLLSLVRSNGLFLYVVYFLVDLLMGVEILKDLENTLIHDAMFFFTKLTVL